ncbi:MAG: gamma-glutamyl-gamma-aminobutyrate hydrolase family protein [Anaeroplasmataceae bacterium]|nr:gamma-glutamyl-gamma-aminobutyrate hydrolase family protein [Anaeroplasmataceae bacterium]
MKKIGVAVRKNNVDYFVHQSYLKMLEKYHVDFDFITLSTNLEGFDAFLIPGGDDIDSIYYGEINYACRNVDEIIDRLDQKIILYALENKKPLLGICRGIQSINVFLGGSLKQDIRYHSNENHFIIWNQEYHLVNSFHHQSIAKLAPDLIILAKSLDDEIEIIKHQSLPIYGLAFHPELIDFNLDFFFNEL